MAEVTACEVEAIRAGGTRVLSAGRGVPVIFVHGVGLNADVWRGQFDAFSRSRHVVAYDMLNHGEAPSSIRARQGLDGYVDQLLHVADDLALDRFHLVGHSMGALVATAFALRYPERVRSLCAMNAVWCRDPESSAAVMDRASELKSGLKGRNDENAILRWFGSPIPSELREAASIARQALAKIDPEAYARSYELFARSDRAHEDTLKELRVPTLFFTGEFDPNSTPAMSEAMARVAPKGRAIVLPGARHMMFMTAASLVNDHLERLLAANDE